ncbi:MAG: hypothetical protein FWC23_05340 [Chitinispirillia bacterium]|nr:hypothetical protein [Chitinispirillia bacterium]
MNSEIAVLRGRLAVAVELAGATETGINCDIAIIRAGADKYVDKAELKSDQILAAAVRIKESVAKLRELKALITSIKIDLGEE